MAKITSIEEMKERYAAKAPVMARNWIEARDVGKFPENWQKVLNGLLAKVGRKLKDTKVKNYTERVGKVTEDYFRSRVEAQKDFYFNQWLKAMSVPA